MTRFLPARIFPVSVLFYGSRTVCLDSRASPSRVRTDMPGVEEDRTGCEEVARGLKSHFGKWQGTCAASCRAARDDAARVSFFIRAARLFGPIPSFFLSFFSLDPTSPLLALLLISGYPGLRLTNRFRLRALRAELDAEAAGLASGAARPSSRPGITIGRSARPSGAPRQPTAAPTAAPPARSKRQRSDRPPLFRGSHT
uniref:Uncharacterized protein n=1 Tax=Fagus sylvatica TaxID=28930 RepID=A0A2N9FPC9_FAGSY